MNGRVYWSKKLPWIAPKKNAMPMRLSDWLTVRRPRSVRLNKIAISLLR